MGYLLPGEKLRTRKPFPKVTPSPQQLLERFYLLAEKLWREEPSFRDEHAKLLAAQNA